MNNIKIIVQVLVIVAITLWTLVSSTPIPDSAGLVEMPPGLAYGGIPYGSVTGKVADYYANNQRSASLGNNFGDLQYQSRQPIKPVYY